MVEKIIGPPGTGKTTQVVKRTAELVGRGEVRTDKICATSLTRATKWALLGKFRSKGVNIGEENIRTLHSWAYKSFLKDGKKPRIVSQKEIAEFFKNKGFEYEIPDTSGQENEYAVYETGKDGNRLLQMFNLARITWDGEAPLRHTKMVYKQVEQDCPVSFRTFVLLFKDYINWLRDNDLYDYTRLLTEAFKGGLSIQGDLLILDEFQDLGNLHNLIVKRWFENFKYVLVCGDDDQAIFTFAGATPTHLINLRGDREYVLPVSYRLPRGVHELAEGVISANKQRIPKTFKPRDETGRVDTLFSLEDALALLQNGEKKSLLLARNNYFVEQWKEILDSYNIPYKEIGKHVPIPALATHLRTLKRIKEGKPVDDKDIITLIAYLKGAIRKLTGKKQIRTHLIAEIGECIKKRQWTGTAGQVAYWILTRSPEELFTEHDAKVIKKWEKRVEDLHKWLNPAIQVGTIHSAKGLEADRVILDTRITKKVVETFMQEPEAERRVLYVGITRAKEELYLLRLAKSYTYEHLGLL